MSPTPFTLVSASFQRCLEPNHLLQTCRPAGLLVPQPVSLTKGGRNAPNLPFPRSSWIGMKSNLATLELLTVKSIFYFTTHPCLQLLLRHQCRTNPAGLRGRCVTPQAVGPILPQVLKVLTGAGLALGFRWLTWLSPLEIQGKLSNVNIGLALPHLKEEGSP